MSVCKYHPDRPGVGVCVRCRAVICSACCTRLDGINHCHACLKTMGQASPRRGNRGAGVVVGAIGVVMAWLAFFGLFWWQQGLLAP